MLSLVRLTRMSSRASSSFSHRSSMRTTLPSSSLSSSSSSPSRAYARVRTLLPAACSPFASWRHLSFTSTGSGNNNNNNNNNNNSSPTTTTTSSSSSHELGPLRGRARAWAGVTGSALAVTGCVAAAAASASSSPSSSSSSPGALPGFSVLPTAYASARLSSSSASASSEVESPVVGQPLVAQLGPFRLAVSAVGVSKKMHGGTTLMGGEGAWRITDPHELANLANAPAKALANVGLDKKVGPLSHAGLDVDRTCGEDAVAVRIPHGDKAEGPAVLAVCDGVGGWAEAGYDPGLVSHGLCKNMVELSYTDDALCAQPVALLQRAYDKLKAEASDDLCGSTTACVATLSLETFPDGDSAPQIFPAREAQAMSADEQKKLTLVLRAGNVGDSGFVLIRNGEPVFEMPHRVHPSPSGYNPAPFQLAVLSPKERGKHYCDDSPQDCIRRALKLEPGDIVVLGSDGLLDNVSTHATGNTVKRAFKNAHRAGASDVAQTVQFLSHALLRKAQNGYKVDDISIMVLMVEDDAADEVPQSKL